MEIKHLQVDHKGKFFIEENNKIVGELTYVMAGDNKMIIDHTLVGDELKGKGAGKLLVEKAVDLAVEKSWKIMPLCPFAKKVMEKEEKYASIIF